MVCYDIRDEKRLRKVFRIMKGFGSSLQYSIFKCSLTPIKYQQLLSRIDEVIEKSEDRVMIVDLGPHEGTWVNRITFMGQTIKLDNEQAYIF